MTKKMPSLKQMLASFSAYLKTQRALCLAICIILTLGMAAIFVIAIVPTRYDLRVGQVPNVTIAATKDVVDEVTTEQRRTEAANAVTPTYKYQEGVTESVLTLFDQIFAELRTVHQYAETLPDYAEKSSYTREELDYAGGVLTLITLRDYQLTTLMNCSREALDELYTSLYSAIKNTMSGHVTQGQENDAIQSICLIVGFRTDTDMLQNVVQPVLKACIQSNMVIDQEATDAAREEARNAVEPTVYKQGQNIVVKGEGRVKLNQIRMLETLGLLSSGETDLSIYLGGGLLVVLVMTVVLLTLRLLKEPAMADVRRLVLLSVVMAGTLGLCVLMRLIDAYAAPMTLCAMLLSAMLSLKSGILCNAALTILVSSLAAGGSQAFTEQMVHMVVAGLVSGTVAAMMMSRSASRVRALATGIVVALLNFLVTLGIALMTSSNLTGILEDSVWFMAGGVTAGLVCIALQPLLEVAFNLPTPMRLLELINPNAPLLRRLMLEAPGTYHHSILVANLAEASAEAVGANPLLARVGAYYHDIGKLKRPLYFKENQIGEENAHDHTDPQVSAAILTAHTRDGVALAKQYRLPYEVQRIIAEHHGNTPVMFFYHKALQQAGGNPVDINAFRYDGERPSSKESAVIMLCDTIEAAVRSQKAKSTPEQMEDYIVKLVRGKLADGQLNNAPLTLNDIDDICIACTNVLKGVYHERIEYPDMQADKRRALRMAHKKEGQERPTQGGGQEEPKADETRLPEPEPDGEPLHVAPPEAAAPVEIDELMALERQGELPEVDTENVLGFLSPVSAEETEDFAVADEQADAGAAEAGGDAETEEEKDED